MIQAVHRRSAAVMMSPRVIGTLVIPGGGSAKWDPCLSRSHATRAANPPCRKEPMLREESMRGQIPLSPRSARKHGRRRRLRCAADGSELGIPFDPHAGRIAGANHRKPSESAP